jgi:hypothetical protein
LISRWTLCSKGGAVQRARFVYVGIESNGKKSTCLFPYERKLGAICVNVDSQNRVSSTQRERGTISHFTRLSSPHISFILLPPLTHAIPSILLLHPFLHLPALANSPNAAAQTRYKVRLAPPSIHHSSQNPSMPSLKKV